MARHIRTGSKALRARSVRPRSRARSLQLICPCANPTPTQGEVIELRGEVRGLKVAARTGPRTAASIPKRPVKTFERHLAEFKGSLDEKLDEKLAPLRDLVIQQRKLIAEQRRLGARTAAVILAATMLASIPTVGVAVWGLLIQSKGTSAISHTPPLFRSASALPCGRLEVGVEVLVPRLWGHHLLMLKGVLKECGLLTITIEWRGIDPCTGVATKILTNQSGNMNELYSLRLSGRQV